VLDRIAGVYVALAIAGFLLFWAAVVLGWVTKRTASPRRTASPGSEEAEGEGDSTDL